MVLGSGSFRQAQRIGLVIVMREHETGDIIGHLRQHRVAVRLFQGAEADGLRREDLDVHFVVGRIHTGRVVDGVGVEAPAREGELDAGGLGHAEVCPLPDDLGLQIAAIDAHAVIGAVADIGMAFMGGLHIGADAAEPEEVCLRLEEGVDQLVRGDNILADTGQRLDLRRQRDRLGRALENAAAFRDQLGVIVCPA